MQYDAFHLPRRIERRGRYEGSHDDRDRMRVGDTSTL